MIFGQRCAEAKTTNGWETRAIRAERSQKLAELKEWGKVLGIS